MEKKESKLWAFGESYEGYRNLSIDTHNYYIEDDVAALCHCLLILSEALTKQPHKT